MESLYNDIKSRGESLHSSSAVRLSKRPSGYDMGTGRKPGVEYGGLEGTESGWGSSQRPRAVTNKQKPESKPTSQNSRKKSTRKIVVDSEASGDELDILSSQLGSDDASSITRAPKAAEGFIHDGRFIPHKETKSVLASLKFKKNKTLQPLSSQPGPPSSQPSTSGSRTTRSKTSTSPPTCPSPPTPVPKTTRPRPRPIQKTKVIHSESEPDASSSKIAVDAISVDEDEEDSDPPARKYAVKRQPAAFPMPSPTRLPQSLLPKEFPISLPLAESKALDKVPRKPAPFVMPSPLSKDKKNDPTLRAPIPAAFPMPSPLSKDKLAGPKNDRPTRLDKGKGKAKVQSDDDEAEDNSENVVTVPKKAKGKNKGREPAPFPMSTQVLSRIGDVVRSESGKRCSPGLSDEDRDSKKTKRDFVSLHEDIHADFDDEGDSILITSSVDPKTLCPYCDTPLPSNPSPLLLRLLSATKEKSSRDPRPSNLLGRKAPLGIFIVVCQRHQFESQVLPEAELKGWPKSIDWKRLGSRVRQMKTQLQALINDVDSSIDNDDWDVVYTKSQIKPKKTPRSRCIFWQEIIEEVRKTGTRSVTGVQGQFANFEKAQPGYYGELGSAIIQQTLYDLFPPDSVDPAVFTPLTANEFVQRVMVPEVAVRLIMDDQFLDGEKGMGKALTILRESSSYGAAMFPDDSAEAGKKKDIGLAASEQIVFDRAMKRRKELEEEDLREEQARQEEEAMVFSELEEAEKKTRKRKTTTRAGATESDAHDSDHPVITARPRPKPKPVAKIPSTAVLDPAVPPARSRSRVTRSTAGPDVETSGAETTAEMSSNDSDACPPPRRSNARRATSEARQRSPSVSEFMAIVPTKPRPIRSTKGSFASLSLSDSSEGEKSTKSTASRNTRSSSRAPDVRSLPEKKARSSSDMDVDSDDSEPEIVNTDSLKTPKPRSKFKPKPSTPVILNDVTPKPAMRTMGKDGDLAPLLRARSKRMEISSSLGAMDVSYSNLDIDPRTEISTPAFQVNYSKGRGPLVAQPSQDYGWLLTDQEEKFTRH